MSKLSRRYIIRWIQDPTGIADKALDFHIPPYLGQLWFESIEAAEDMIAEYEGSIPGMCFVIICVYVKEGMK